MKRSLISVFVYFLMTHGASAEDLKAIIKKALPATVGIEWKADKKVDRRDLLETIRYHDFKVVGESTVFTSGAIVSPDGLIVAPGPPSVPEKSKKIIVALTDGSKHEALPLVVDRRSNLTLLKADLKGQPHLEVDCEGVEIGDGITCVAAYDLAGRAVTRGIVAAKDRSVSGEFPKLIQTDVSVGLMSAGGPMVNEDGKMVGVVVARTNTKNAGVSFAIPALHIRAILDEANEASGAKEVKKPYLGVELRDGPAEKHALIARVIPDSPADKADIKPLDLILSIEGKRVDSARDAQHEIAKKKAYDSVTLRLLRKGKEQQVTAELVKRDDAAADSEKKQAELDYVSPGQVFFFDRSKVKKIAKPKDAQARAFEWIQKAHTAEAFRAPAVRVERSGIDKRVEDLSKEMNALSEQIGKLTDAVNKLQGEIESSKSK